MPIDCTAAVDTPTRWNVNWAAIRQNKSRKRPNFSVALDNRRDPDLFYGHRSLPGESWLLRSSCPMVAKFARTIS